MNPAPGVSWSSTALDFGLDLAVRATAILAIVLLVQTVLARRRPLIGSAVGHAGLIGLLLLPFSTAVLPSMPITCLPPSDRPFTADALSVSVSPSPIAQPRDFGFAWSVLPASPVIESPLVLSRAEARIISTASDVPPVSPVPVAAAAQEGAGLARGIDWPAIPVAVYGIGVLMLLARIGASICAVARLRRSCANVSDVEWTAALERWRIRLGISRPVILAWSPLVSVPVVLGWLRPTVVVPGSLTGSIPRGHADAVLLHELSHVRRNDYPWNLVLRFVQALYWPHLLVWLLGRTVGEMRERACDDLCVHEMGGCSAYRETLLAVASGMVHRPGSTLGLAMARPSRLSRRLSQIERTRGNNRCVLLRPTRIAIASLAVLLAGVTGAVQLVRIEARAITIDEPVAAASSADGPRVFHLRVVASDTGQPVPNADVRVFIALGSDWRKTDAQGRLDITYATGPSDRSFSVDIWGKGRAMQRHNWGYDPNKPIPEGETIKLQPGETLGGIVRDEAERPIAGATVYLWSHNYKRKDPHELLYDLRAVTGADGRWQTSGAPETTGELLGFRIIHPDYLSSRGYGDKEIIPKIADLRAGKAVTVLKKGVPIEGRVVDADGRPVSGARVLSTANPQLPFSEIRPFVALTDAHGRFRTGQVKPGEWHLIALAKGHGPGVQMVKIGRAVPQVEIALGKPHTLKGRVIDTQGKPIVGAFIGIDRWRDYWCLGAYFWTDTDGRFRWDEAPGDDLIANVDAQGFRGAFERRVAPSNQDVLFTLQPSISVRGKLTDAETKKLIDNATVEYSAIDPKSRQPLKWTNLPEIGTGTGVYLGQLDANFPITADEYKIRVRAPGYLPFVSRTFRREEKVVTDYDIALVPGTTKPEGPIATVLRPDGKPLAGARLVEMRYFGSFSIADGIPNVYQGRDSREGRTTAAGRFGIPQYDKPWRVFILGDDCYAVVGREELSRSTTIQAKPLAVIEGQYLVGSRPQPARELELNGMIGDSPSATSIHIGQKTTTDGEGRFAFRNVIPAPGLRIAPKDGGNEARGIWTLGEPVRVEPGKTTRVILGGKGRPVIGRVEPPMGWTDPVDFSDRSEARIDTSQPLTPYPPGLFRGKTMKDWGDWDDWAKRWQRTPEGRDYEDRRVSVGVPLAPDGSFRFDDVVPGEYRLSIRVNGEATHHVALQRRRPGGPFARVVHALTVPSVPGGRSDEPLDLGVLRLQSRVILEVGEPAPALEVTTIEGKKLAVPGDFQGKFLLINFGTLWDIMAPTTIADLNEVYQKLGSDPRFAMLSLTCELDTATTRKSIADKGQPWPQAIVGPLSNPVASAYGIDNENASASVLVGPDGKIVAQELFNQKIAQAVGEALGRNP